MDFDVAFVFFEGFESHVSTVLLRLSLAFFGDENSLGGGSSTLVVENALEFLLFILLFEDVSHGVPTKNTFISSGYNLHRNRVNFEVRIYFTQI